MRRRLALGIWIAVLLASLWIVSRASFTADLSAFLPRTPSVEQQMLVDQLREGVVSRLLLIALEGEDEAVLGQISRSMRERLSDVPAFSYVNNGVDEVLESDARFLLEHRYLLSPGVPEQFSAAGLRAALERNLDLLASATGAFTGQLLPSDPTGAFLDLLDRMRADQGPQKREGVWFSRDAVRALMIAQTRAAGSDLDGQEKAIEDVRSAFADANRHHSARLLISGPGLFAVSSRAAVKQDAARLSMIALVMVAGLMLAVYRSARLLGFILLPVLTGALVGGAAVALSFGAIHGITLGFGVTLIGEAVDYAIYLYTHAGSKGQDRQVMRRLWPMLRLGVMTSACGFGAMLFSGFPGLAQLAVFSVAGLCAAVLVTRWVLPVLATPTLRVPLMTALARIIRVLMRVGEWLWKPLLLVLAIAGAWLIAQGDRLWDDDLSALSPLSTAQKQLDRTLRQELGAPDVRYLIVARASTMEDVLRRAEEVEPRLQTLQASAAIRGYDSPARYLPSVALQRARQNAIPEAERLRANLRFALAGLPFRPDAFDVFIEQAEAARRMEPVERADMNGTALALKADSLLIARRGEWFAMLPLTGVADVATIRSTLSTQAGSGLTLIDIKQESDALYRSYRVRASLFSAIGAVLIVALLFVQLRSATRVFNVVAPLAGALVIVMLVMVAAGVKLTLFHLVALLLVVGVGSNYSLFFERGNLSSIGDPPATMAAVLLCNASTTIGFGVLAWARSPVLSAIGLTVALGALSTLVLAALSTSRTAPAG